MTPEQAASIRTRHDTLHAWMTEHKTNSYKREELPAGIDPPSNEELGALEVFEFMRDKPDKKFGYVKCPDDIPSARASLDRYRALYGRTGTLTTFTGDKLGAVQFGRAWSDNFGGIRVPISVQAITGDLYHGTYYASSGDYARVKKALRVSV